MGSVLKPCSSGGLDNLLPRVLLTMTLGFTEGRTVVATAGQACLIVAVVSGFGRERGNSGQLSTTSVKNRAARLPSEFSRQCPQELRSLASKKRCSSSG
jgi:hypothetical protein